MNKEFNKNDNYFQIQCDQKALVENKDENWFVESIEIEWWASTKHKDRVNDIVEPKAFEEALKLYKTNPIILLQHKNDKPIWVATSAEINKKWLYIKAKITEDVDWVFSALRNGVIKTFSIWYRLKDVEVKEKTVDGQIEYEYIIKSLDLYEISLVSVPANPYALLKSLEDCFKSNNNKMKEEVKEIIKDDSTEEVKELDEAIETVKDTVKETDVKETEKEDEDKAKEAIEEEIEKDIEDGEIKKWDCDDENKKEEEEVDEEEEEEKKKKKEDEDEEEEEKSLKSSENDEWDIEWDVDCQEAEKSTETVDNGVETKSVEEDKKNVEFTWLTKRFDEQEKSIKELEEALEESIKLTMSTIEKFNELEKKISWVVVKTWYSYEEPKTTKTAYTKLVNKIKTV